MAETSIKPSVVFFSSCEDYKSLETIKLVLSSNLPQCIDVDDGIKAYPYHIENKYYDVDIYLCSVDKKTISNQTFAESVQAAVLYFDSTSSIGLSSAASWLPFVNEFDPEIKILLCKTCAEDNLRVTQEWCLGNGFELVELEPQKEDEEVEDDFPETTGIQRIIQALNAHVWPNLVMKSKGKQNGVSTLNEDHAEGSRNTMEESLEELLDKEDDFSELFSQLPVMKARVESLGHTDRKAAAEQVVRAFWKAMGGDDEEFDEL